MIAYFDTSAIVPRLIKEPTTEQCRAAWDAASIVLSSRIAEVETAAALARAQRAGRIDLAAHGDAARALDEMWAQVVAVPLDDDLIATARRLTLEQSLRGYDAVHCASALLLSQEDVVVVAGDHALLTAAAALNLYVWDINIE